MTDQKIIIILIVVFFFILFFINNNRTENYDKLVIVPEKENSNQICFDKNKLYGNNIDSKPITDFDKNKLYGNNIDSKPITDFDKNKLYGNNIDSKPITDFNFDKDANLCVCSGVWRPVNCNGNIYSNSCAARCAGEDTSKCIPVTNFIDYGKDKKNKDNNLCMCTMDYNPVNCNGNIYGNSCAARCAGEDTSKCIPVTNFIDYDSLQPKEIDINNSYSNQHCFDKNKRYENIIDSKPITDFGKDKKNKDNNSCMCTMDYNPVNCNGNIYSNSCVAKCAGEDTSKCIPVTNFIDYNLSQPKEIDINNSYSNQHYFDKNKRYGNNIDSKTITDFNNSYSNQLCFDKDKRHGNNIYSKSITDFNFDKDANLCVCSGVWRPVNCNGNIYSNSCAARCAGEDTSKCIPVTNFIDSHLLQPKEIDINNSYSNYTDAEQNIN
jgi:hypothetical protein